MIACNYYRCPVVYNWFIGDVRLDQWNEGHTFSHICGSSSEEPAWGSPALYKAGQKITLHNHWRCSSFYLFFYLSCCIYDTSTVIGFICFVFSFSFFSTRKQIFKPGSKQGLSLRGLLQKLIINALFKNVFHMKYCVFPWQTVFYLVCAVMNKLSYLVFHI